MHPVGRPHKSVCPCATLGGLSEVAVKGQPARPQGDHPDVDVEHEEDQAQAEDGCQLPQLLHHPEGHQEQVDELCGRMLPSSLRTKGRHRNPSHASCLLQL